MNFLKFPTNFNQFLLYQLFVICVFFSRRILVEGIYPTRYGPPRPRPLPLQPPPRSLPPAPPRPVPKVNLQQTPPPPPRPFGYLPPEAREAMRLTCESGFLNCKFKPSGMLEMRNLIFQYEMEFMRSENMYNAQSVAKNRLSMTHQLRQKMLKVAGLGDDVESADDGTWEHDVLLTEYQSKALMDALPATGGYGYGGSRYKRGVSLFLEQMTTQRWDISRPILYMIDSSIEPYERLMITNAHRAIESNTCIRFQYSASKPAQSHIKYIKFANPALCGLSYVGRVTPANPVYLSFMCPNPVGIAIHETMHALGAQHEHLHSDRDTYLEINWGNINPQYYDYFAIADPSKFTSYGTPYDYGSIMHYQAFISAIDPSQPTMIPRVNPAVNLPLMGQRRGLSRTDIQLLNAMYCKGNCVDSNVACGYWAIHFGCSQNGWLQANCRKSCKLC